MASVKNVAKGVLVRRSLSLCKLSIDSGFYLEAIALTDSVISECMNSVFFYSSDATVSIKGLKDGIRKLQSLNIAILDETLNADTLTWGKHRNSAIHGFTKLSEFDGADWDSRRLQVKLRAEEGYILARRWLRESAKHKI
jgi:hypothetical protein